MLVDMHIHTRLSDGKITVDDVVNVFAEGDVIALTDHNCVEAWEPFCVHAKTKGFVGIRGVELRLRGRPDYLVYFSDRCNKGVIEAALEDLNAADHELSRLYYEEDFGGSQFTIDFFDAKQRLGSLSRFCDTRLLAEMITCSGVSSLEIIKNIRDAKGRRIGAHAEGKLDGSQEILDCLIESEAPNWAFDLARENNGEIVLAHPLKEAKRQERHRAINERPSHALHRIASSFVELGGTCMELCFHDAEFLATFGYSGLEEYANDVITCARQIGLSVVCGSDLHGSVDVARDNRAPMERLSLYAEDLFPEWLRVHL